MHGGRWTPSVHPLAAEPAEHEVQFCVRNLVFLVLQIGGIRHNFDDNQLLAFVPNEILLRAIEAEALSSVLRHLSWCELPAWSSGDASCHWWTHGHLGGRRWYNSLGRPQVPAGPEV